MSFLNDVSPTGAVRDIIDYFLADRPLKPFLIVASCCPPALMIYMLVLDSYEKSIPPPPTVTYVESWPLDRSIEETKTAIGARQKLKDALMEKQRQSYKAMGRAVGMDVEKIERESNALREQQARSEARLKAQNATAERAQGSGALP